MFSRGGRPVGEDPSENSAASRSARWRNDGGAEEGERCRRRRRQKTTATSSSKRRIIIFIGKSLDDADDDETTTRCLACSGKLTSSVGGGRRREAGIRTRRNDKIQVPASARTLERMRRDEGAPFLRQKGASLSKTDDEKRKKEGTAPARLPSGGKYGGRSERTREETRFIDVFFVDFLRRRTCSPRGVRSRELEKCEWVKLQPVSNEFSKFLTRHPEADVKVALEQILVQWSCVHVGDAFEVDFSGFVSSREDEDASTKTFTLKVVALKVEGGEEDIVASLIETDVEVDLAPSIEHDEVIERIETLNRNDEEKKRNERRKSPRRKRRGYD